MLELPHWFPFSNLIERMFDKCLFTSNMIIALNTIRILAVRSVPWPGSGCGVGCLVGMWMVFFCLLYYWSSGFYFLKNSFLVFLYGGGALSISLSILRAPP